MPLSLYVRHQRQENLVLSGIRLDLERRLLLIKQLEILLMDIPAIDKAIFLIDRKDFGYSDKPWHFRLMRNNDLVDVDETDKCK